MNNTINHVSDSSVYVTFDPTGTEWPSSVTNVQNALELVGSWARTDTGLPNATPSVRGIAAIATEALVDAGTDNTTIITPALLKYRLQNPQATQLVWGYTRYATDSEAVDVANDTVSITPRSANVIFNNRRGTETIWGSSKISSTAQATAGTDDTTSMSPLKVKQAIDSLVPVQSNATESFFGLVKLATVSEVRAGTIREGFAISPYTFNRLTATETDIGVLRVATNAQMNAGTDDTTAVTPAKFNATRGNASTFGVVRLATSLTTAANTALSSNANVLPSEGNGVTSGDLYRGSVAPENKYQTKAEISMAIPIGGMFLAAFQGDSGNVMVCDGRALNVADFPELYSVLGTTFGGGGAVFNIPDMRGVVARGADRGRGIDPGRSYGSYQDDAMQPITAAWTMDDQAVTSNFPPQGAVYATDPGSINYDAGSDDRRWRAYRMWFDSSRVVRTANETRMKNVAINYVIRVK